MLKRQKIRKIKKSSYKKKNKISNVFWLKDVEINTLVNTGLVLIIFLFGALAIIGQFDISRILKESIQVTFLRAPTAESSAAVNTAINKSLAALRGWVLIEDDSFLKKRQEAWRTIRFEEKSLIELSKKWSEPKNKKRLNEAIKLLDLLEHEQMEIELIAHNIDNIPSLKILLNSGDPVATSIVTNITTMINYAKTQKATSKRLTILGEVADFRGSFALSVASMRAYLLTGEKKFKDSFNNNNNTNENSLKNLIKLSNSMTAFENKILSKIKFEKVQFENFTQQMISSRQNEDWNKANFLLKTTAVITSNKLLAIFEKMVESQNELLVKDALLIKEEAENAKSFHRIFLIFSLSIALYITVLINKKYTLFRKTLSVRNNLVDQNVLMAIFDKDGVIIRISNALCRCLGGVKDDFIGKNCNYFLPKNENIELLDSISKSLLTGKEWKGEFKRYSVDGENIWLSSTIFPVKDENIEEDTYHNILENITNQKLLERTSVTDGLTSLFNRRKFNDVIEHEIKLAKRHKTYITLAIIDIDHFKLYNDNYGHPEGDAALIKTATAIRSTLSRPDDYVFRLGGEEFGIVFNSLNEKETQDILERIRSKVEELKIVHNQNTVSDYLTISLGAKVCEGNKILDKDIFYKEADKLLYTAKLKRNTVVIG